jgi:hypothetical protein
MLQRLSIHIDEAECAVVRAMLMRMDAEAAEKCNQQYPLALECGGPTMRARSDLA